MLVNDPESGLSLVWRDQVVRADFSSMLPRLRQGPLHKELLVRAAKLKGVPHPVAVDATAGLGEDSLLLAAAGFEVTLFERDSLIAALLRDAVLRARDNPTLAAAANRMHVIEGDSIAGLRNLEASPDVVFLDPMFPARTKSAAVKKKLQVIQLLEEPCDDEAQLMEAALAARPRKVIIKRPIKGPHLAGIKPSYSLTGKAVRYDVLVPPR
jgi:16S rRNA (guanine1516-N2)-methyltransferase